MRWMRRWLLGKDDSPVETDFPVAADKDLQCTETGQVLTAFRGKSAFRPQRRTRRRPGSRACRMRSAGRGPEALRGEVYASGSRVARDDRPRHRPASPATIARTASRSARWAFETEPGVLVPVILFRGEPAADRPLVVYIGADRALAAAWPAGAIEALDQGRREHVALVEPHGMGEGQPDAKAASRPGRITRRGDFLSLHLNRPLLGQRVFDVLQALRGLDSEAKMPIHLIGVGAGGPIVLHAALLSDRVASVTVERSIPSWSLVARTKSPRGDLAGVLPGVLASYDLPDLAAAIAPRRLTIREPLDPAGRPLP